MARSQEVSTSVESSWTEVDNRHTTLHIGVSRLVLHLLEEAAAAECDHVALDCAEANVAFYSKCGLERGGIQMVKYLDDS